MGSQLCCSQKKQNCHCAHQKVRLVSAVLEAAAVRLLCRLALPSCCCHLDLQGMDMVNECRVAPWTERYCVKTLRAAVHMTQYLMPRPPSCYLSPLLPHPAKATRALVLVIGTWCGPAFVSSCSAPPLPLFMLSLPLLSLRTTKSGTDRAFSRGTVTLVRLYYYMHVTNMQRRLIREHFCSTLGACLHKSTTTASPNSLAVTAILT